jgi:hypothetical protein
MDFSAPHTIGPPTSPILDSQAAASVSCVPADRAENAAADARSGPSRVHGTAPLLPRPQAFRLRAAPAGLDMDPHVIRVLCALFLQAPLTIAQARRISQLRYEQCRAFIAQCAQSGLVEVFAAPQPAAAPQPGVAPSSATVSQQPAVSRPGAAHALARRGTPAVAAGGQRSFLLPAQERSATLRQRPLSRYG